MTEDKTKDRAGAPRTERPDSNGTNSRPRDETISQTGPGIPDDTGHVVEISPEEEKRIEQSIREL
jgi:hypothetical protein